MCWNIDLTLRLSWSLEIIAFRPSDSDPMNSRITDDELPEVQPLEAVPGFDDRLGGGGG